MASQLKYKSHFFSRSLDIRWDVMIYVESDGAITPMGLDTPSEDTLSIEWDETKREEPIGGSSAVVQLVSPGDRTLTDLYTERTGEIRMDVLRNGDLYWSGSLDPEFYEETYAEHDDYDVSITFSDFGPLARVKYDLTGIRTLFEIISAGLQRIGLNYDHIDQKMISTTLEDGSPLTLDAISVRSDNFQDEDGEWMSYEEVIAGILQPLALKMVQRGGVIYIYDINGLYNGASSEEIWWASDNQVLAAASVANDAKVTLSVYSDSVLIDNSLTLESEIDPNAINLTSNSAFGYYSYYPTYSPDWRSGVANGQYDAYSNISFTLHVGVELSGLKAIGTNAKAAYIQPFFGATADPCVAWYAIYGGHFGLDDMRNPTKIVNNDPAAHNLQLVMQANDVYLPKLSNPDKYFLRLELPLLVDPRYNPFTEADENNEKVRFEYIKEHFSYVMVPVVINLKDADGTVRYHYSNLVAVSETNTIGFTSHRGSWVEGKDPIEEGIAASVIQHHCMLEYYDADRRKNTGVTGWKTNKHNIGTTIRDLTGLLKNIPDGEFIPYPPEGGYIEVKVYSGLYAYMYVSSPTKMYRFMDDSLAYAYRHLRWILYKAPKLTITSSMPPFDEKKFEDIEYSGLLNENAKEDVEIEAICGTATEDIPTSRAMLLRSSDLSQIHRLSRAGRTDTAEQLLIGTLYSQYAERKNRLSGTAGILGSELHTLTDACQGDRKFLVVENIENCKEDETEIVAIEIRPDEYTDK